MIQRIAKPLFVSLLLLICSIASITCKTTAGENTATAAQVATAAKKQTDKEKAVADSLAKAKADTLLKVTSISLLNSDTSKDKVKVEIFHTIRITVNNLDKELEKHDNDLSKIILYIDGNAVSGLHPTSSDGGKTLQFDLKRLPDNTDNTDAWKAILSRGPRNWERTVPITIGFEKERPIPSTVKAELTVVNRDWFKVFCAVFVFAIILFCWLAWKSDIIRDTGPKPNTLNDKGMADRKPYSLARTQMAAWFFVIIISYVFIWMVMKDHALNASVLGLMGISTATALGSAVLDSSKRSDQANQLLILEKKKNTNDIESHSLKSAINSLVANIAATPAPTNIEELKTELASKQADLSAKEKEILLINEKLNDAPKPLVSKNFISDILSDDEGISFHRFQIFTWTIVLMDVFIWSVYHFLSMPEFDATLLGLMGISGGTYIGFKLPNQQG